MNLEVINKKYALSDRQRAKGSDQEISYGKTGIRRLESTENCVASLFFAMPEKWTSYETVPVVT
jgi:hypothetical protein